MPVTYEGGKLKKESYGMESYAPMGALKVEGSVIPASDPVVADRMLGIEVPQTAKDRPLASEKM